MSDGISGKDFYIPALHEVLCLESSTLLNDLKDSVGTRKWELLATRLGFQANYYTNRHKQRRWIAIDSISKSNSTPPFSPLNLVDGKCAGQALKLPKWVESSCSRNIVEILKRIEHSEDNEIEKCNDNSENANTNQPSISRNQHHDICFVSPSKEIEISEERSVCETPINCEMNECAMDTTMANSGANIKSPYDQNRKISFVSPNAPMFCNLHKKLIYLKSKIVSKEINDSVELDLKGDVKKVVHNAFKHTLLKKKEFRKEVTEALLDLGDESSDENDTSKCNEFASFLVDEIHNYEKKLSGKDSRVRFSPRVLRMCMSLWLRSSAGYKEFREANLQVRTMIMFLTNEYSPCANC